LKREEARKRQRHQISAVQSLRHRRVWHLAAIGFSLFVGMYSVIFWMPQAVKSLSGHYMNTLVGVLVMIPYAIASMTMIIVSRSSDLKLERKYHTAIPVIIAALALMLLGWVRAPLVSIILFALVVAGGFSSNGPFWAMPSEFLTGASAASGIALINSVANLGGFVGPYAIGFSTQKTGSLIAGLAIASLSLFVSAGLILLLPKAHSRDEGWIN
jgi:MFS transporter, ACS family, tartrate transporter